MFIASEWSITKIDGETQVFTSDRRHDEEIDMGISSQSCKLITKM